MRRDLAGAIGAGLFGQVLLIASGILVARGLGVEDRGYLALLLLFPLCISTAFGAGVPAAVTFHLASNRIGLSVVWRVASGIYSGQCLLIIIAHAAIVVLYLRSTEADIDMAAWLALPIGPVTLAHEYGSALIQGQRRFAELNRFRVVLPGCYVALLLVLFASGAVSVSLMVVAWLIALTVACGVAFLIAFRCPPDTCNEAGELTSRQLLRFGLRGLLGGASPMETFRLDQLLAGLLLPPAALGLYVVGRSFANIPSFVATGIMSIAFPSIANAGVGKAAWRLVWKFFLLTVGCNLVMVVVLGLLIPWLLPLAFGDEFRGSVVLAQLLLVATSIHGCYRVLGEGMRGLGLPQISSIVELAIWPCLFVGLPVFALMSGITGVAMSVVLSYLVAFLVMLVLVHRVSRNLDDRPATIRAGDHE